MLDHHLLVWKILRILVQKLNVYFNIYECLFPIEKFFVYGLNNRPEVKLKKLNSFLEREIAIYCQA